MQKVLIVDDDQLVCEMIELKLNRIGVSSDIALNLSQANNLIQKDSYDIILLDVNLPDGNGIDSIPDFKNSPSNPEIIIITGNTDVKGAELALKTGAWDYIPKPISTKLLELEIRRALAYRKEKKSNSNITFLNRDKIIGNDPSIKLCLEKVALCAATDQSVLVYGQTGTGKELFARAIHLNSNRAKGPFIVLDCASLPDKLLESVLFGHTKGSFTGADKNREGLMLHADGGTLFMDEVGELPLEIQKSFLRVLQEKSFRPIGGHQEIKSDFRVVAATNKNLEEMSEQGSFRNDLLFRIAGTSIQLPPLRKRAGDIDELVFHYIRIKSKKYNMPTKGVSDEFLQILHSYSWPGNVRELVNTIEHAIANAQLQETLLPIHLPINMRIENTRRKLEELGDEHEDGAQDTNFNLETPIPLPEFLDITEMNYIQDLIHITNGDIEEACKISGVSRTGLYNRLKKYNIARPS